jgi:hypothetical protein
MEIQVFGSGLLEEWFGFQRNYKKVEVGQELMTGVMRFAMMRNLLQGEALRIFERERERVLSTQVKLSRVLLK